MGFIEETGAAQHMRDSRIAAIYEGANGIHAIDLVQRKLPLATAKPIGPVHSRQGGAKKCLIVHPRPTSSFR